MSEVIVITSGKGGVGKTTTVANIGTGLAMLGKKVVLVDTDIGLRNLDVVLGLENRIVYNLVDVVNGSCRLRQALIKDKRHPELYLLPSAQTKDKTAVSPEQMIKLTEDLREEFDYVLLDCPAGIEQGFKNAIAGADRALVVTTPEVSAIRDADRIIGLLEANELRDIRLIINRLRPDMIARGDMMSVDDVIEILAVDLIGTILDDEQIVIAANQGDPLSGKNSQAETEYLNICKRLLGEDIPFAAIRQKKDFSAESLRNLYKEGMRMSAFFRDKKRSAGYARDRMKLLLISERIDCSPQMIKMLRNDMIHTVKKYLTIDDRQVVIKITQEPAVLHAYIPVLNKKDR